jgi:hypothetical protein
MALLEAEEIARLEAELDRCTDEKDIWQKRTKKAEARFEVMRQKIGGLEREVQESRRMSENVTKSLQDVSNQLQLQTEHHQKQMKDSLMIAASKMTKASPLAEDRVIASFR